MVAFFVLNYALNYFQVVRALNLIRDSWDGFGTKPESVYIPRGTLQVCMLIPLSYDVFSFSQIFMHSTLQHFIYF